MGLNYGMCFSVTKLADSGRYWVEAERFGHSVIVIDVGKLNWGPVAE